jgi:hypothetical protein
VRVAPSNTAHSAARGRVARRERESHVGHQMDTDRHFNHANLSIGGSLVRVNPRLSWRLVSNDRYERLRSMAALGRSATATESISTSSDTPKADGGASDTELLLLGIHNETDGLGIR